MKTSFNTQRQSFRSSEVSDTRTVERTTLFFRPPSALRDCGRAWGGESPWTAEDSAVDPCLYTTCLCVSVCVVEGGVVGGRRSDAPDRPLSTSRCVRGLSSLRCRGATRRRMQQQDRFIKRLRREPWQNSNRFLLGYNNCSIVSEFLHLSLSLPFFS